MSQIFLSRRSNIQIDKLKSSSNEYIFDLTNTWELNLDIVTQMSSSFFPDPKKEELIKSQMSKIKKLFEKKNSKRQELGNFKGKLLIEKQIIEESKRKVEENFDIFKDQIREMEENVDNKEEYIKIFEKKLREVEIYVQKNTKMLVNSQYDCYKNFIMNDFINENTNLLKKKEILSNEKFDFAEIFEEAKNENNSLKKNTGNLNEEEEEEENKNKNKNKEKYNYNNDTASDKDIDIDDVNDDLVIVNTEKNEKVINIGDMISKKINSSRLVDEQEDKEIMSTVPNKPTIYNYNNNLYGKININMPLNPKAKKEKIEKMNKNKKLKTILKSYNNHIKLIENKNKLLKAQMTELHNKFINSKIKIKLKILIIFLIFFKKKIFFRKFFEKSFAGNKEKRRN